MTKRTEAAIERWHEAVNSKDISRAREVVTNPVVVEGTKGAGPISPDGFADWITRSGIELRARSYHPITERVVVVEQDARWPRQGPEWLRVATMFRVTGDRVSAALRFSEVRAAVEFASRYRELAATE